ncbi:hypothetical protein FBZ82_102312 [Azospirillum brasilense]|uniref:Copper chaperone PCu(A)C n=1 Tax=Azospirillum brasilense TaxID=192 RepID=A0A560BJD9_AZOBR|nr:copper chaperone PCu(A)C [Azospirillum brasilense]TWA72712.1 hypothetical protein FBZ82_102312 [Azospirillum brasilense]
MKRNILAGLTALALLASVPADAEPVRAGDITVEQAWARATVSSAKTGAVYLTVRNSGTQADRIASITAPVAGHAMGHETRRDGDVMKMQEAPLTVPPNGALEMMPGGTHIMLMDLAGALKPGQGFPLTVTFEKAGTVQVPVTVGKPGAMGPE